MHLKIKYIIASLLIWTVPLQVLADHDTVVSPDGEESDIRINPQVDYTSAPEPEERIEIPRFINRNANHIRMNRADWGGLSENLAHADSSRVSIVHVGDSHLQADMATAVARRRLQSDYGDAGRGLVAPLKMAATNEPRDYAFKGVDGVWVSSKLMKRPWTVKMGFTGVSTVPMSGKGTLEVSTLSRTGNPQTFDIVRMFHSAQPEVAAAVPYAVSGVRNDSLVSVITLPEPLSTIGLDVSLPSDEAIYGMSLERSRPGGLLYHVVGNNGATYTSYNGIDGFASGVALLNPDLIILSLGANEAFSRMTSDEMYSSIGVMVDRLRKECPDAGILLTTPMECLRSTVTRRRKGRRRRVRSYAVNPRVSAMRDVILRYGRDHGIATYDFYEVAGGAGASAKWISAGMMARDRIHNSAKGYGVQGELLYEALKDAFSNHDLSDKK
ncbi:GDSL-type esterase/lipase family protein [uncultured Muribaculum sp.]|uniref:GDSL-type esterase/lipase family protein n=1 Tax=uncultured Muribaculum sp. TaxID=1918613 RepID=UPI0025CD28C0|nr:GDSL-type esterase/lipase family protein [uncultured Muribaculum sp.]